MSQATVPSANGVTFEDLYDLADPVDTTREVGVEGTASPQPPTSRQRDPRTGQFLPTQQQSQHPGHLVAAAKNLGLDDETIAGMSSAELRQDIQILSTNRNTNDHQSAVEQDRINRAVQQQLQQQQAQATPKPGILDGLEEFDHESLKAVLGRIVEKLSGIESIEQKLNQVYEHVGRKAAESDTQRLDRAFSDLPEEYKQYVGTGARDQYTNRDFEYMVRANLFAIAQKLAGPNATVESIAKKIPEAALRKFPNVQPGQPRRKKQQPIVRQRDEYEENSPQSNQNIRVGNQQITPQMWNNSGLAPASHRQSPGEPRGQQRALETVQALLSQLQGQEDDSSPTSLDEFL